MNTDYMFRIWTRDEPQDGRAYLDIWDKDGGLVSQRLVPVGLEDAYFELVDAHVEMHPNIYRLQVNQAEVVTEEKVATIDARRAEEHDVEEGKR